MKLCTIIELCILNSIVCCRICYSKGFWRENDVLTLTADYSFRLMAQQTRTLKELKEMIKCENKSICEASLVEKLLSCEFRIFHHFVTIFRNLAIRL